jgi:hypothetical protein
MPPPAPPPPPPPPPPPAAECPDLGRPPEAVATNAACRIEPSVGTFTPEVEWKKATFAVAPASDQVMMTPIVISIDGDDRPEILFVTYDQSQDPASAVLRAVAGDSGADVFSITGQGLEPTSGLAAADLDRDGTIEIVAVTRERAKAFTSAGQLLWTSPPIGAHIDGDSDNPAIGDMDGDGSPEIVVGRAILRADGTLRGAGAHGIGSTELNAGTTSFPVDLDADGIQEVITGNAAYDPEGQAIWSNGEDDGYVAVADFDHDGRGEVVVSDGGGLRLQAGDGTVLWRRPIPGAFVRAYGGPPTVADFDGDGEPEIGVAANNTYTVFDGDGTELWQKATQDVSSGNTGSSVYDFEGDGIAEAVYADETRVWVFNGPDGGVKLESTEHTSYTWLEYPVIADADGDGETEIVFGNSKLGGFLGTDVGITVLGDASSSWRPSRRVWNQHAYHLTNVDDDGTIPRTAELNWLTFNSFRSGDLTPAAGNDLADLFLDVHDTCADECASDTFVVFARAGNRGLLSAEGRLVVSAETASGAFELDRRTVLVAPGSVSASERIEIGGITAGGIVRITVTLETAAPECEAAVETASFEPCP